MYKIIVETTRTGHNVKLADASNKAARLVHMLEITFRRAPTPLDALEIARSVAANSGLVVHPDAVLMTAHGR